MTTLIPKDPSARKRLVKKVLITAGVVTGVAAAAVIIHKLTAINVEVETLVEIASEIVDSTDGVIDAVEAVLP